MHGHSTRLSWLAPGTACRSRSENTCLHHRWRSRPTSRSTRRSLRCASFTRVTSIVRPHFAHPCANREIFPFAAKARVIEHVACCLGLFFCPVLVDADAVAMLSCVCLFRPFCVRLVHIRSRMWFGPTLRSSGAHAPGVNWCAQHCAGSCRPIVRLRIFSTLWFCGRG